MLTAEQNAAILYNYFLDAIALPELHTKEVIEVLIKLLEQHLLLSTDESDFVVKSYIEFLKEMEK